MRPSPTADRLMESWRSGELERVMIECRTESELAAKLGLSHDAYRGASKALRAKGEPFPRFKAARPSRDTQPDRWPNVAAFDADPPPVPVMPTGHQMRGVSTLVDGDGEIKQQWIKTRAIDDDRAHWLDAIREMAHDLPRDVALDAPPTPSDRLLSCFPVGDPHVGLLSWPADAGCAFDLKIAERNLVAAFAHLVNLTPPSAQALIILIGDNTHSDGQHNATTAGTRVDVDGRTRKMVDTLISIARRAIALVLEKHGHVTLIVERGNHDELLSMMVALALSFIYEDDPRVTIDTSPEMHHWFRFGKVLIGTHHGHKTVKPMDLLGVMAVDRAQDWAECSHRRWYTGHLHHMQTKEVPGCIIETLPTLAGSDAWHRGMGYRSQRAMYADVYDAEHGHVNRHFVGIAQLEAAQ